MMHWFARAAIACAAVAATVALGNGTAFAAPMGGPSGGSVLPPPPIVIPPGGGAVTPTTVLFFVQAFDSCQEALPGAKFVLVDKDGTRIPSGVTAGNELQTIAHEHGKCPEQQGDCKNFTTGCASWKLEAPATGSTTYELDEFQTPNGYMNCNGGTDCKSQVGTVTINSDGTVKATVKNEHPTGKYQTFPSSGTYAGTATDPVVFHDWKIGNHECVSDALTTMSGSVTSECYVLAKNLR